jgi:hypothetical protein
LDATAFQHGFEQIDLDGVAGVDDSKIGLWHLFLWEGYDRNDDGSVLLDGLKIIVWY